MDYLLKAKSSLKIILPGGGKYGRQQDLRKSANLAVAPLIRENQPFRSLVLERGGFVLTF
jgi:hypothetical protein